MTSFPASLLLAESPSGVHILVETLRSGGFILLLIVLCSVVALSVTVITYLRMREDVLMPPALIVQLRSLGSYAARGDVSPLQRILEKDTSELSRLAAIVISGHYTTKAECTEVCSTKAREALHHLERDLPFLEVMVTVAPLLGLLGTTAGLVGMFSAFGDGSGNGPDTSAIAHEIGVALRCTIAGLLVAVPSVVAHTLFVRKLDGIAMKLENVLHDTILSFYQHFEIQRSPSGGGNGSQAPS